MEPDLSAETVPRPRATGPAKVRSDGRRRSARSGMDTGGTDRPGTDLHCTDPTSRSTDPKDRGAGTIAGIGICLVLLGFSVAALVLVQASVAAARAATAADLAALAGADALRGLQPRGQRPGPVAGSASDAAVGPGPAGACGVAGEVAARNNAALRECTADPEAGILTVEAQVRVPALPYPATATARAGPPG